ncbi:hypothetical protein PFISCL1PPCAC_2318, partial [Pristionchus fissidentatus]
RLQMGYSKGGTLANVEGMDDLTKITASIISINRRRIFLNSLTLIFEYLLFIGFYFAANEFYGVIGSNELILYQVAPVEFIFSSFILLLRAIGRVNIKDDLPTVYIGMNLLACIQVLRFTMTSYYVGYILYSAQPFAHEFTSDVEIIYNHERMRYLVTISTNWFVCFVFTLLICHMSSIVHKMNALHKIDQYVTVLEKNMRDVTSIKEMKKIEMFVSELECEIEDHMCLGISVKGFGVYYAYFFCNMTTMSLFFFIRRVYKSGIQNVTMSFYFLSFNTAFIAVYLIDIMCPLDESRFSPSSYIAVICQLVMLTRFVMFGWDHKILSLIDHIITPCSFLDKFDYKYDYDGLHHYSRRYLLRWINYVITIVLLVHSIYTTVAYLFIKMRRMENERVESSTENAERVV